MTFARSPRGQYTSLAGTLAAFHAFVHFQTSLRAARAMKELRVGEYDVLSILKPDSIFGALIYLVVFVILAMVLSRILRAAVHAAMARQGHIDRTTISFVSQFGTALTWVMV